MMSISGKMAGLAALLLLASCASSTPIAYYLLTPQPGSQPGSTTGAMPAVQVSVPAYVDRPQLVFQSDDGTVELAASDRWAEAVNTMVRRVLAQDIAARARPATAASAIAVGIDDFIFGDGFVQLSAHWTIAPPAASAKSKATPLAVHTFAARLPVADQAIDSYVQGMSQLTAQLAADIAP